jgi:hypothetical protein
METAQPFYRYDYTTEGDILDMRAIQREVEVERAYWEQLDLVAINATCVSSGKHVRVSDQNRSKVYNIFDLMGFEGMKYKDFKGVLSATGEDETVLEKVLDRYFFSEPFTFLELLTHFNADFSESFQAAVDYCRLIAENGSRRMDDLISDGFTTVQTLRYQHERSLPCIATDTGLAILKSLYSQANLVLVEFARFILWSPIIAVVTTILYPYKFLQRLTSLDVGFNMLYDVYHIIFLAHNLVNPSLETVILNVLGVVLGSYFLDLAFDVGCYFLDGNCFTNSFCFNYMIEELRMINPGVGGVGKSTFFIVATQKGCERHVELVDSSFFVPGIMVPLGSFTCNTTLEPDQLQATKFLSDSGILERKIDGKQSIISAIKSRYTHVNSSSPNVTLETLRFFRPKFVYEIFKDRTGYDISEECFNFILTQTKQKRNPLKKSLLEHNLTRTKFYKISCFLSLNFGLPYTKNTEKYVSSVCDVGLLKSATRGMEAYQVSCQPLSREVVWGEAEETRTVNGVDVGSEEYLKLKENVNMLSSLCTTIEAKTFAEESLPELKTLTLQKKTEKEIRATTKVSYDIKRITCQVSDGDFKPKQLKEQLRSIRTQPTYKAKMKKLNPKERSSYNKCLDTRIENRIKVSLKGSQVKESSTRINPKEVVSDLAVYSMYKSHYFFTLFHSSSTAKVEKFLPFEEFKEKHLKNEGLAYKPIKASINAAKHQGFKSKHKKHQTKRKGNNFFHKFVNIRTHDLETTTIDSVVSETTFVPTRDYDDTFFDHKTKRKITRAINNIKSILRTLQISS